MKNNQKGSTIVLGLIIMFFTIVAGGALSAWINNETRLAPENRDALEAEYAAEAGIKRAFVALNTAATNWTWVGTPRPFTDASKTYNVTISGITAIKTTKPDAGTYTVVSVGKVGNAKKTVTTIIDIAGGAGNIFEKYSAFGGTKLALLNSGVSIVGDVATNGSLDLRSSNKIVAGTAYTATGTGIPKKNSWGNDWNYNAASAYAILTTPETLVNVSGLIPAMPVMPAIANLPSGRVNLATLVGSSLTAGTYYYNGNYNVPKSLSITGDVKIYIYGNFTMQGSVSITGASGASLTIYVQNDTIMKNSSSILMDSSNGSYSIYSLGTSVFQMTNTAKIVGKTVIILTNGNIDFNSDTSINKGFPDTVTKIYSTSIKYKYQSGTGDIQFSGNFVLGGTALVATLGSIDSTSSTITVTKTVFVADGDIGINSSTSAGAYSNSTLYVNSGGSTLTYGANKNEILTALGLGSGPGGVAAGGAGDGLSATKSWSSQ